MHLNSLLAVTRASFPIGVLLAGACAQASVLPAQVPPPKGEPPANAPADPRMVGLPQFLLMVPGGSVEVGLKADELIQAACEVVFPAQPDKAPKISASKLETLLKQSASLLGRQKVEVQPFLLARTPVTCAQWERFVIDRRKKGGMRPPFDWWRFGREDDYNDKLKAITLQFPGSEDGPLQYWDRHGADLPYSLTLKNGTSIADWPVTYIDYREANEFAAWIGMRLPTENEWTRAARGDGKHVWPWATTEQSQDAYTEQALEQLRLLKSSDKKRKPVGSVVAGQGPFGHEDMFGQVWQFVAGLDYRPINGEDAFKGEWKRMQKDKVGSLLTAPPLWRSNSALGKGGSYLSGGEPIQLLVDQRAPMETFDVLEAVGLRLAKSLRPGYDMLYSLLRSTYNRSRFAMEQEVDLTQQVGAERYELGDDGFPTAYHAVTFAPVNWLSQEKNADLGKLLEKTQIEPMLIGTFATTEPLADPSVPAGHYSVLFRKEGMPRELTEAIKAGNKEMIALAKKPKKDDDKDKDKEDDKDRKGGWREVLTRYGLTEEDVATKEAANGLKFVRIDGVQVTTERDCFLLHGNEGKIVAAVPAPNQKVGIGGPVAPELLIEADAKGRAVMKFHIGSPATSRNARRIVDVPFWVTLDRAAPTGDTAWRLPGD